MSFLDKIVNYLRDQQNLRKVVLISLGIILLGGVVLFSDNIQKLLNPPSPGAALELGGPPGSDLVWGTFANTNTGRAGAQLVNVDYGGQKYLYLIGGAEHDSANNRFRLIDKVERILLDETGAPATGAVWESQPNMVSGHADFRAFQYGRYLYVVAGDIHVPDVNSLPDGEYPLLFSTIERLNLSGANVNWEPIAKLTGVNFFPEVLLDSDTLHIVGGVYGNPYSHELSTWGWSGYEVRDPVDPEDDAIKWPIYKGIPTIGDVGITGSTATDADGGTIVAPGTGLGGTIGAGTGAGSGGIIIQQVQSPGIAELLSKLLLRGDFVTTVSEHYQILSLSSNLNPINFTAGELGVDYAGTLNTSGIKIFKLGHLRFVGTDSPSSACWPVPVPQGRYGHELIKQAGELLVVGGATWSMKFNLTCGSTWGSYFSIGDYSTFWVIDDEIHPITTLPPFVNYAGTPLYQFVGNVSYKWNGTRWQGTNEEEAVQYGLDYSLSLSDLSSTYAFHDSNYVSKGRAFFGLAEIEPSRDQTELVAIGGLESGLLTLDGNRAGIDIQVTNRTEQLSDIYQGWRNKTNAPRAIYGLTSIGLGYRSLSFGGQVDFKLDPLADDHYPDYRKAASNNVLMFDGSNWHRMPNIGASDEAGNQGISDLIYSAELGVHTLNSNTTVYAYKVNGSTVTTDGLPSNSVVAQILGPFIAHEPNVVDPLKSTVSVIPNVISADGVTRATVTVTLKDSEGNPAWLSPSRSGLMGDLPPLPLAATIKTSRSDWPIINQPEEWKRDDQADVVGSPAGGAFAGPFESYEDQRGFRGNTTDQYIFIDDGTDKDTNPATGAGQAQFEIYSSVETLEGGISVKILLADGGGDIRVAGYPPPTILSLSADGVIFTLDGVPSSEYSTIVADPVEVVADGEETSTITATLKDHNAEPVTNYWVDIISNRGELDIINPEIGQLADNNGQAIFEVSSTTRGHATITARYGMTQDLLRDNPVSLGSVFVDFKSIIDTLIPSSAYQSELVPILTATGKATQWQNGETTAKFIPPATIGFYWIDASGIQHDDMNSLPIEADGISKAHLRVAVSPEIYPENTSISLDLAAGGGSFWPSGSNNITILINAQGEGDFYYRAGNGPGIIKITAQLPDNGPSDELWFVLRDDLVTNPYSLEVYADPPSLSQVGSSSNIRAILYRYNNGQKSLVEDDLTFLFAKDDSEGTLMPASRTVSGGIAESIYTRGPTNGRVNIFVTLETVDGWYVAGQEMITNSGAAAITVPADWYDENGAILPRVVNSEKLEIENLVVGASAQIGFWTFEVYTPALDTNDDGQLDTEPEYVRHPFQVLFRDPGSGPQITSIDPHQVLRPGSGSVAYDVVITGAATHFYYNSVVNFEYTNQRQGADVEINSVTYNPNNPAQLVVNITVYNNTDIGYWDVSVTTGNEVATKVGHTDFLVTTDTGYIVDIWAQPDRIRRDGESQSQLTARVGQFDQITGEFIPLPNINVVFEFDGTDGGSLDPDPNDENYDVKTNSQGYAYSTYTTDEGDEGDEVTIIITADIDGIPIANRTTIIKEVVDHEFELYIEGNGEKLYSVDLPIVGNYTPPALVAHVFDPDDNDVGNVEVEFMIRTGSGNIIPALDITNANGLADDAVYYRANNLENEETVEIVAKTTIPNVGTVYSNDIYINLVLETSRYRLEFKTDNGTNYKEIPAGGADVATLTATLTYDGSPVSGWLISFTRSPQHLGDNLSVISNYTNASGRVVTDFIPGSVTGSVIVTARPIGLGSKQVIINKTANPVIDPRYSTISAVPRYVPISDDNSSYSIVTVTLRNSKSVPLAGKSVTLDTNRSADMIRLDGGAAGDTANTDSRGRAIFWVSSTQVGTSTATASVDNLTFSTVIVFEDGTLVPRKLDIKVPFQSRDYDNEVLVYITEQSAGSPAFVHEVYVKNARPDDRLAELYNLTLYFHAGEQYTVWVKGRQHLARAKTIIPGSSSSLSDIQLDFTATHYNQPTGLLVGDLLPNSKGVGGNAVVLPFHDNYINTIDMALLFGSFFQNSYLANLNWPLDNIVNNLDLAFMFGNYGPGADGGPPPYD